MAQWMQCDFIQTDPTWADAVCNITPDTHDGGHWKRRKDAKYGDQLIERGAVEKQARRTAIDEAIGVVLPQPVEESQSEPPPIAAKPARRIQLPKGKSIAPTEKDAIDLRLKQMEDDEKIVIFIATQLH